MKNVYFCLVLLFTSIILVYCIGAFYAYFYPMDYQEEIKTFSAEYEVDGAIIASVVNVESGFDKSALSSKNAKGLMQLLPSTAEWIAQRIGQPYKEEMLFDSEYNLRLGTYYLSYLFNYFGDEKTALCAYNAGQGNVKSWLENLDYSTDGKTLKKIPFKETENYIKKIYKNYHYYKNRYK